MYVFELIVEWLTICLQATVVALMAGKKLVRRFLFFFAYSIFATSVDLVRQIPLRASAYFLWYWSTEALCFLLSLFVVYECFQALFGDYRRFARFRLLFPGTVAVIWAFGAWRAWVNPPVSITRGDALLISVALSSAYTIIALMILFFVLASIVLTRTYPYEFHIVAGLALASVGMVAEAVSRAQFGDRFAWLNSWAYPIASLLAVMLWVRGFLKHEDPIVINQPPEKLLHEMNEDFKIVKQIDDSVTPWHKKRP